MHPVLNHFIRQFLVIVAATLMSVFFVAFLSIPFSLGAHPGDPRPDSSVTDAHMS